MDITLLRQKLLQHIDNSDEQLLQLLYAIAKEHTTDSAYKFSQHDINEFDERRKRRLSGESHIYSWQEAKAMITRKRVDKSS